jgi:Sulfatase
MKISVISIALCGYISSVRAWSDIKLSQTTTKFLFNITEDPYEDTDVYSDDAYSSSLMTLSDRMHYWMDLTIDSNTPDTTDQIDAWDTCGHVCPWLSDNDTTISIEQIYDYDDAPNIVFVLVDDWGYNDFGQRSTYLSFTTPTLDSLADNGILLSTYYTNEVTNYNLN